MGIKVSRFMSYVREFEKRQEKFIAYIVARGAEILQTTNQYEVMRFRAGHETSVVYKKETGHLTFTGQAGEAWNAFLHNSKWEFTIAAPRPTTLKKNRIVVALLQRDGKACFYCGRELQDGEETLEHLVPVAHGGTSHLSNMVLADDEHNSLASHLPVIEKVKLRERLHAKNSVQDNQLQG